RADVDRGLLAVVAIAATQDDALRAGAADRHADAQAERRLLVLAVARVGAAVRVEERPVRPGVLRPARPDDVGEAVAVHVEDVELALRLARGLRERQVEARAEHLLRRLAHLR